MFKHSKATGTVVGGAGALGGRMKALVVAVVSTVCRTMALACVAHGTADVTGEGRAGTTGGGRKDPVVAAASMAWRA